MAQIVDHLPPPDPRTVATIGHALAQLPLERIREVLPPAVIRIYAGAFAKGWSDAEAKRYATRYCEEILAVITAHKLSAETTRLQ